jgi:LmbE family N-acetylglucosaminyl deacetylase
MKFLDFNRVLCLSPHPDDVEYSMAATILKHKDTHFDIVCLTQGGDCDNTTSPIRKQEVENAWKQSNSSNYTLYFSPCRLLKEKGEDEWIYYLEKEFTLKNNYDAIITTSSHDSHFEHRFVQLLAAPLSRVKFYSLLEYKSPSSLETFQPNLFVSIEDFYQTKQNMLSEFKTQLSRSYFEIRVLDGFHTNFQSLKKKLGYVEQFKITQFKH